MMENQKIKDLFAGERFGCGFKYLWVTTSNSQSEHNESLNRLEYKLACLLKEEDAERKAKIIAQGRALEALKAERKDLRGTISEQNDTIKLYKKADDKSGGLKDTLLLRIAELNEKVDRKELLTQELTCQIEELNRKNELLELKNQELADYASSPFRKDGYAVDQQIHARVRDQTVENLNAKNRWLLDRLCELEKSSEVLLAELKGQQSKNRAQENRLEHLKSVNRDLLDANDKLKRTNKALLTACDKYYEELTEARGGREE